MTLVYQDGEPEQRKGVHALIIGVGHYRHLAGGAAENLQLSADIELSQLSSPPHSARHVATWVLNTWAGDTDMPLRSLRMLVSQRDSPASYAHPLVTKTTLAEADMDEIELETRAWAQAGEKNPENLLLFYFCGHGVATSVDHPLLAADAGKFEDNLFRHALNFSEFRAGMQHNPAQKQLFLVDACRVGSSELVENATERGLSVIARKNVIPDENPRQPTIKSALQGAEAFGLGENPSPFAQALPKVFTGAAWRQVPGGWVVCASTLANAIDARVREVLIPLGFREVPETEPQTPTMTLKKVSGDPMVPVEVSCSDPELMQKARFQCSSASGFQDERLTPSKTNWFLEVPRALYDFKVEFEDGMPQGDSKNEFVSPPYYPCQFEVDNA